MLLYFNLDFIIAALSKNTDKDNWKVRGFSFMAQTFLVTIHIFHVQKS